MSDLAFTYFPFLDQISLTSLYDFKRSTHKQAVLAPNHSKRPLPYLDRTTFNLKVVFAKIAWFLCRRVWNYKKA